MRRNLDAFELRLDYVDYNDAARLSYRSRVYDLHFAVELRRRWGDPRPLADFIETLVGGTLQAWASANVPSDEGREMAAAIAPHWERQIHRFMERMERRQRHLDEGPRYRYDTLYGYTISNPRHFGVDWAMPEEDPKAKQKARELLLRQLDAGQEKSFKKNGEFRVTAKDGKVYTIKTARSFNVVAEDGTKYCGQTVDTPIEDQMLAQKLLLEHDPDKFFKNANVSPAPGSYGNENMTATEIRMRQMETMIRAPRSITGGPWNI